MRAVRAFELSDVEPPPTIGDIPSDDLRFAWKSDSKRARAHARTANELARIKLKPEIFPASSEFSKVAFGACEALLAAAVKKSYADGEFVYLQDDDADHLYFVASGHIRLSYLMDDGSAVLYAILPAGESFGELGVFEENSYCDMATAVGTTVVAGVSAKVFRALGERYPQLNTALARLVARRYRSYVTLMQNLSLKSLPARLAQALLRLADQLNMRGVTDGRNVAVVGSMVTQADLGLMARGARGNVNRALKSWERAGWITLQDRCIYILNRSKLEHLAVEEDF